MNKTLENIARVELKKKLRLLTNKNHILFKKMYSPNNPEYTIDYVVDKMPEDKLNWALTQVENTLNNKSKTEKIVNWIKNF